MAIMHDEVQRIQLLVFEKEGWSCRWISHER